MITAQQFTDRLKELSNNPKLLKQFNDDNFTNITEIFFDISDDYTDIIIYTKYFKFDIELFDCDNKCNYSLQLRETAWQHDFDDYADEENIRCLFSNEGEISESAKVEDIDIYLSEILPSKEDVKNLESRIKRLLKFKDKMEEIVNEKYGNRHFVLEFAKLYCNCF